MVHQQPLSSTAPSAPLLQGTSTTTFCLPLPATSSSAPLLLQDLLGLYQKAGAKGQPVVLLMTDNQIVKEGFLVFINDLLANGDIPDLCTQEDRDGFCTAVRGWAGRVGWVGAVVGGCTGQGRAAVAASALREWDNAGWLVGGKTGIITC